MKGSSGNICWRHGVFGVIPNSGGNDLRANILGGISPDLSRYQYNCRRLRHQITGELCLLRGGAYAAAGRLGAQVIKILELPIFTMHNGQRAVRIPECAAEKCRRCMGCGVQTASSIAVVLENQKMAADIGDGTNIKVAVQRANPAMIALWLFFLPLALIFGCGLTGYFFQDGETPGMFAGAAFGFLAALIALSCGGRRWRPLRVWIVADDS